MPMGPRSFVSGWGYSRVRRCSERTEPPYGWPCVLRSFGYARSEEYPSSPSHGRKNGRLPWFSPCSRSLGATARKGGEEVPGQAQKPVGEPLVRKWNAQKFLFGPIRRHRAGKDRLLKGRRSASQEIPCLHRQRIQENLLDGIPLSLPPSDSKFENSIYTLNVLIVFL